MSNRSPSSAEANKPALKCTWCLSPTASTRDHVIPLSIGGTRAYALPSCKLCQTALSKAEQTLARKSILALHALTSGIPSRHKRRSDSGILQVKHLMAKNPLGGYNETVLRAGGQLETLSYCEVKVVPGEPPEARARASLWEESERLLTLFKAALLNKPGPDGLVCEINVSLETDKVVADCELLRFA